MSSFQEVVVVIPFVPRSRSVDLVHRAGVAEDPPLAVKHLGK